MTAVEDETQFRRQLAQLGSALRQGRSITELADEFQQLAGQAESDEERAELFFVWAIAEGHEGRYGGATSLFEKCVAHTTRPYIRGLCLKHIALIHLLMGDLEQARRNAEAAVDALESFTGSTATAEAKQLCRDCDWAEGQSFPTDERRLQLLMSRWAFGPHLGTAR